MKNGDVRARGKGDSWTWTMFVLVCGVLSMITQPAAAQQQDFPGEIVGVGKMPPILSGPYRIQVGDVLAVEFFKTIDMNQIRTVGPDGDIYLPLVGRLNVVGRTVDDVTTEITEGYSEEMINPQITLSVQEYSGLQVYVSGEVNRPGTLKYRGGLTLVQAISEAGGFNVRGEKARSPSHQAWPGKRTSRVSHQRQGDFEEGPGLERRPARSAGYCLCPPQEDRQPQHLRRSSTYRTTCRGSDHGCGTCRVIRTGSTNGGN